MFSAAYSRHERAGGWEFSPTDPMPELIAIGVTKKSQKEEPVGMVQTSGVQQNESLRCLSNPNQKPSIATVLSYGTQPGHP
jgi:hypothetical protein